MSREAAPEAPPAATPTSAPRRSWRRPLLLFLACVAVFAPTATREVINDDGYAAGMAAWRIATTGTPWLEGFDLGAATDPHESWEVFLYPTAGGHEVIHRSPGVVAVALPAYWIAGGGTDPEDYSFVPGSLTAALCAALAVLLLFLAVRQRLGDPAATAAALVFGLTTPVWSVAGNSLWTHDVTMVGILGMAWASARERWWLVGLFGGVAIWGRLHTVVIVAVLGLGLALLRRRPRIAVEVGLVSGAFLGLASLWSRWMYGTWSPAGGYGGNNLTNVSSGAGADGVWDGIVNHLGLWIAPDRGLLAWTPLLVLLAPALARGWRDLPDWARVLPLGGLVYMLVQGQLNEFMGGDGFYGYRLALEMLACVAPAYAMTAHRMGPWARRLVCPLIGLQFGAIALGAMFEGILIDRDDAWHDNALWYAIRTEPLIAGLVALMAVLGWLVARWYAARLAAAPVAVPEVSRSAA